MEPLLAQLQSLPQRLLALPLATKAMLVAAVVVGIGAVAAAQITSAAARYEYVFTQLNAADSAACADALKAAGVPFRLEASGEAIAVPEAKVHDARLLLAGQGLPHQGGVGFELFDKSDLGVSEFTQRVNLQRATEGELARTIQSLAPVREARVHLTLPKKGLFRDDDKQAQAAVMLKLHAGRVLDESALLGVKNLVASAVPGLSAKAVSIVDDSGALLGESESAGSLGAQRKLEKSLEERLIAVLEPSVGRNAVVARVTADLDDADVGVVQSDFDPERAVLKSERTKSDDKNDRNGVASIAMGAAANAALEDPGVAPPAERTSTATKAEATKTWEVSSTITRRTNRSPRLARLSVAVVVDEKTPRSPADVARLAELAKRAVGFDEDRGDLLELSSVAFVRADDVTAPDVAPVTAPTLALPAWAPVAVGAAVGALVLVGVAIALRSRKKQAAVALARREADEAAAVVKAAAEAQKQREAEETATLKATLAAPPSLPPVPTTPREKAIALALADPRRAAQVLESWLDGSAAVAPPAATPATSAAEV